MVDPLGALSPTLAAAIQAQLTSLFSQCLGSSFTDNTVVFNPNAATPTGPELLVYFMPSGLSIIKQIKALPPDSTRQGATWPKSGASEVYVSGIDGALLGNLAFHELMHNRLQLGDDGLHPQGGIAAKSISGTTTLNAQNIKTMTAAIAAGATQWTAGIPILNNGKVDPMSEYYKI
jgi:hypothetical protein